MINPRHNVISVPKCDVLSQRGSALLSMTCVIDKLIALLTTPDNPRHLSVTSVTCQYRVDKHVTSYEETSC